MTTSDDRPGFAAGRGGPPRAACAICCGTSSTWARSASAGRSRSPATCSAISSSGAAGSPKKDYVDGLALAQLAPGPLAAQLAIYLGWAKGRPARRHRASAAAFILPSFVMVLGLSALYVRFGGLSWMQSAFYGIGAAVIAIIARSALKLVKMTLGKDRLLWALFAASAVATAWTESEIIWLFLGVRRGRAGRPRLGAWRRRPMARPARPRGCSAPWPPRRTAAGAAVAWPLLAKIALYFAEAGAFVFGSGLAIVPFLHGGVVNQFHWLTERQFLDAVAVAMITPGPVVITVAFIGYLVAGPLGAIGGVGRRLPALLPVRRHPRALLPPLRRQPEGHGVRRRGHRRRHRRHRRRGVRPRPPRPHRRADRRHRASATWLVLHAVQEAPRAAGHPGRRAGRADLAAPLTSLAALPKLARAALCWLEHEHEVPSRLPSGTFRLRSDELRRSRTSCDDRKALEQCPPPDTIYTVTTSRRAIGGPEASSTADFCDGFCLPEHIYEEHELDQNLARLNASKRSLDRSRQKIERPVHAPNYLDGTPDPL